MTEIEKSIRGGNDASATTKKYLQFPMALGKIISNCYSFHFGLIRNPDNGNRGRDSQKGMTGAQYQRDVSTLSSVHQKADRFDSTAPVQTHWGLGCSSPQWSNLALICQIIQRRKLCVQTAKHQIPPVIITKLPRRKNISAFWP